MCCRDLTLRETKVPGEPTPIRPGDHKLSYVSNPARIGEKQER